MFPSVRLNFRRPIYPTLYFTCQDFSARSTRFVVPAWTLRPSECFIFLDVSENGSVGDSSRYGVARRSVKRVYLEVGFIGFSSVVWKCSQSWRRALRRRPSAPRRALGESGFRFYRVVTAQEGPKTSFAATPKRIFKFLGRLINSFSHFFQFISLDVCGQSTFRTYDFRILLEIGNFNLRLVAAGLAFDWELSVAKEIRFHFRKTFNDW
jgi:hypothetical protein